MNPDEKNSLEERKTKDALFAILLRDNKEVVTCLKAALIVAEVDDWEPACALLKSCVTSLHETIQCIEDELGFNKED